LKRAQWARFDLSERVWAFEPCSTDAAAERHVRKELAKRAS